MGDSRIIELDRNGKNTVEIVDFGWFWLFKCKVKNNVSYLIKKCIFLFFLLGNLYMCVIFSTFAPQIACACVYFVMQAAVVSKNNNNNE